MDAMLEVQVLPQADHSERSEAQLREGDGLARGRLKQKCADLSASLEGDLSARHLFVLGHIQAHIEKLRCELTQIDAYLLAAMQPYAWAHQLLQTIPGIDRIAAAMILIEIGDDMGRFASPARLACWAALSPGNNESAGKRKSGRTRHGNSIIRFILCECANAARMTKSTLASKYKSLMVRKSHKKAIIAVAPWARTHASLPHNSSAPIGARVQAARTTPTMTRRSARLPRGHRCTSCPSSPSSSKACCAFTAYAKAEPGLKQS